MERQGDTEIWTRRFGSTTFLSCLRHAGPNRIFESFGPFTFELHLDVQKGRMAMPVKRGWCFGLPIPSVCLPSSDTEEFAQDKRFHFDVRIALPLVGLLVHYRGWLAPAVAPQSEK